MESDKETQSIQEERTRIMFERFTDRARKVFALANQEAQRFNHEYIGTEHILIGLTKEGSGVGCATLRNLGIDVNKARVEVEKLVRSGPDMVTFGKLPQTPRAKKVVEFAIEAARGMNHNYVGTEHLLLGLLKEEEGVGAQVLFNLGANAETVKAEVMRLLGVQSCEIDSCRLCVNFGFCQVATSVQKDLSSLEVLFETDEAKEIITEFYRLCGDKCKRYKKGTDQ